MPARNSQTDTKEHTEHEKRKAPPGPKHLKVMVLRIRVLRCDSSMLSPGPSSNAAAERRLSFYRERLKNGLSVIRKEPMVVIIHGPGVFVFCG
jgi:hypothetical protein